MNPPPMWILARNRPYRPQYGTISGSLLSAQWHTDWTPSEAVTRFWSWRVVTAVEFDSYEELMKKEDGVFAGMAKKQS